MYWLMTGRAQSCWDWEPGAGKGRGGVRWAVRWAVDRTAHEG